MMGPELKAMTQQTYEEFQVWLAGEVEAREGLEALIGSELTFDAASLDQLEKFLLGRYATPDDLLRPSERDVLDAAARHVGLVIVFNIDDSKWDIDLKNPANLYYRLPIIRFADDSTDCPFTLVTASLDRRTGDYFRTYLENNEELYNGK